MGEQLEISPDTDIINLAYSLAVEPQRLNEFTLLLDGQAKKLGTSDLVSLQPISKSLSNIALHFQHALDLIERQGRRFNYATGSMRFIEFDSRPSALLHKDGVIFHANKPAFDTLNFTNKQKISGRYFTKPEYDRLLSDLASISKHETDKIISVYSLTNFENNITMKMALSKTIDYNNNPIGRLSTFHVKWLDEHGKLFRDSFGLTDVDIDITKSIITGVSLKDLSVKRGRSIATIRNQTKALFSKLNLHSQVELACLFSGFTHFNLNVLKNVNVSLRKPQSEPWRSIHKIEVSDGRKIQYEIVGPANGRSVLFFHAIIGGMMITKAMREMLFKRNIRLIMVWRPFFAGSTFDDGEIEDLLKNFSKDIEIVLDALMVDTCQIIGQIEGAVFAYACAHYLPERILGIVSCGGSFPIISLEQFKIMPPKSRATLMIARLAPILLPMMTRAILAKVDAGYDEEFVLHFYGLSANDSAMFDDPELRSLFRDVYPISSSQGYIPYVKTALVEVSQWENILKDIKTPVTLLYGEQDPVISIPIIKKFIKSNANITLSVMEDAGQMLFYQHSYVVFEKLDEQFLKLSKNLNRFSGIKPNDHSHPC